MDIGENLLDIMYPMPLNCMICKGPIPKDAPIHLCLSCAQDVEKLTYQCLKCGRALIYGQICTSCEKEKYAFDAIASIFWYNDAMHRLIYRYKYGRKTSISKETAIFFLDKIQSNHMVFDVLTYIPISDQRKKQRGFDQTQLMAQEIGRLLDCQVKSLVKRVKDTTALAQLSHGQREREIKDAFCSMDLTSIKEKSIVLVIDDIFTTGTTLNEMALTIKKQRKDLVIIGLTLCSARW